MELSTTADWFAFAAEAATAAAEHAAAKERLVGKRKRQRIDLLQVVEMWLRAANTKSIATEILCTLDTPPLGSLLAEKREQMGLYAEAAAFFSSAAKALSAGKTQAAELWQRAGEAVESVSPAGADTGKISKKNKSLAEARRFAKQAKRLLDCREQL